MQRQSQVLHELKRQSGNTTTVPQLLFHIHNSPTIQQYFSDDQPLNVMDLLTILARLTQSAQGSAISANSLAGNELLTIVLAIHRHYDHIDGAEKATNLLSKALLVRLCAEFCNLCTVDYHETGTSRRIELQQLYSTLIHFYSSVITDSTDRIIPLIESLLESTDARIALSKLLLIETAKCATSIQKKCTEIRRRIDVELGSRRFDRLLFLLAYMLKPQTVNSKHHSDANIIRLAGAECLGQLLAFNYDQLSASDASERDFAHVQSKIADDIWTDMSVYDRRLVFKICILLQLEAGRQESGAGDKRTDERMACDNRCIQLVLSIMQSDGPFGELIKLPQLLRQQLLLVFDLLCPPRTGKVICINPQTRFEAIGLLLRFIFNSLKSSSCILEAISQLQLSKELRKRLLNISAPTPAVEQDPAILISRLSSYFLSDNLFSADAARLMWDLTAHAFSCHQLPELERPSWISK